MQAQQSEKKSGGFFKPAFDFFYKFEPYWATGGAILASYVFEVYIGKSNPKWAWPVAIAGASVFGCAMLPMWIDDWFDNIPSGGIISKCSVVAVVLNMIGRWAAMRLLGAGSLGANTDQMGQSLRSSVAVLVGANGMAWIGYGASLL